MSHRCTTLGLFSLRWCFAPIKEVFRFRAKRWTRRTEHMSWHMLLSIFRHRPIARVAPQQSPILLIDNFDSTFTVIEVKHYCFPIPYRFVDTPQPVKHYNLKCELSQLYPSHTTSSDVQGQTDPDSIHLWVFNILRAGFSFPVPPISTVSVEKS